MDGQPFPHPPFNGKRLLLRPLGVENVKTLVKINLGGRNLPLNRHPDEPRGFAEANATWELSEDDLLPNSQDFLKASHRSPPSSLASFAIALLFFRRIDAFFTDIKLDRGKKNYKTLCPAFRVGTILLMAPHRST